MVRPKQIQHCESKNAFQPADCMASPNKHQKAKRHARAD